MEENAKKLLLDFTQGDRQAFAGLVRLIFGRFFRMFYHMGADRMAAEDLCQEFFLAIYRGAPTFRPESRFFPWAYSIARNIYSQHAGRASSVKVVPIHPGIPAGMGFDFSDEFGVPELLSRLSEEKRMVFELKHFQELKFSEIAELLGVPEGTVKSRMFAAIREIREILSRRMT
ncbi:MAG: RNA polymerase sigma factor [Candidatus Wallbacteria bacterium]|nr:RNA polymerase sigma factor [Candidatus Wallbacteria bacterium]